MKKLLNILITSVIVCTMLITCVSPVFASLPEFSRAIYDWEDFSDTIDRLSNQNEYISMRVRYFELLDQKEIYGDNMTINFGYSKHYVDQSHIHSGSTGNRFLTIYGDNITINFDEGVYLGSMNRTKVDGACLRIIGDNCTINNADITYCSAVNGGAIYVEGDNCVLNHCTFKRCSSIENGGAVYLDGYNCKIVDCYFYDCSATKDGGAIYVNDDAVIEDCYFENCSAGENGGSIYDNNAVGDVYVKDCEFVGGGCSGDGVWVACNGDAWIDGCTYGNEKYYYDCDDDKFHTKPRIEEIAPYSRPGMNDYSIQTMIQNKYCDVIYPLLANAVESELRYFIARGTTDYGMGWKIDYENPLTITAQEGHVITRIDAILTGGEENYEKLIVDAGTKCKLYDNPYDFSNSIAKEQIVQIDDINSDSVTLTVNGNLDNYGTMRISDIIIYFEEESAQDTLLGSVLSGGNLAIVTAVAGLVVGFVGGIAIRKKKSS